MILGKDPPECRSDVFPGVYTSKVRVYQLILTKVTSLRVYQLIPTKVTSQRIYQLILTKVTSQRVKLNPTKVTNLGLKSAP